MTEPGESEQPAGAIKVTFNMSPQVYDRMWTAAARDGLTFTDLLNRSVDFYDRMMSVPTGCTITLRDPRGSLLMVVTVIRNVIVETYPHLQQRPPRARLRWPSWWPFGQ